MIVVLVAPPLLAAGWFGWKSIHRKEEPVWEEIVEVYHILYEEPSNSSAPVLNPPHP